MRLYRSMVVSVIFLSVVGCEIDEPAPELRTDKQFVIYDFSAKWCGPCRKYEPVFRKYQKKFARENIIFKQIDADQDAELTEKFDIEAFPTVVVTADGKVVGKFRGGVREPQLVKLLKKQP